MSRARIVCSEILSRMSPINHFDDKIYPNLNSSQEKIFNLCLNECTTGGGGEVFVETPDVSNVLSEMNTTVVDDCWFRPKTSSSMDCIDTAYLNDENFLSTKDPDMCSGDIGLELVLVNKEKDTNLDYCGMQEKPNDLVDPLLNLVPMNEVLLRKTEIKCDKDLYASDGELNLTKVRPTMWDTLSIASRKSDCDAENNGDFSDFNLLSFSFDTNDHINSLETISDNNSVIKNNSKNLLCDKLETNNTIIESTSSSTTTTTTTSTTITTNNDNTSTKQIVNKKTTNIKRPNILRTSKIVKTIDVEQDNSSSNRTLKSVDKNMNVNDDNDDSIFNFANESEFIILPEELNNPLSISVSSSTTTSLNEEEKRIMKKHHISELNNMTGAVAVVSNSTVNSKSKTKITIRTENGEEKYEGNTAELTEAVGTTRKNRRPTTPVEGEHIVTSVRTAASLKEEKKTNNNKVIPEPEDRLVKEMLSVLGITDDMLFTILTNLGLRMWVCPEMECRRIFNRLNSLKTHILSHYGLKPFKCDFPGCPWSFYTSFKLKRHRDTHLKRKDFKCTVPDCNRTFTTIYNLNTHLKLHERPARLKCLVRTCNFKFQTRRAMEMHLKTHEISLAPYKCTHPGCNKLYFSCSALTAHSRCHQHKEEELRCQWENCGRLFDKPCRLKAHMRQHTGDKPYVCKFKDCKWAFPSSSKLKRHQYKHNNERKFRCTIGDCNKAFMRSEHLREHTFTHIAQRTFQCTICGEKCSGKATLYVHKKKFHPNENTKTLKQQQTVVETQTLNNNTNNNNNNNNKTDAVPVVQENQSSESNESDDIPQFLITLLPSDEPESEDSQPVVIQDIDGKEYEVNLDSMKQLVSIPTSTVNNSQSKVIKKPKAANISSNKSCARTYLPYMEVSKKSGSKTAKPTSDNKLRSALITPTVVDKPVPETPATNLPMPSDLLLGSELLQNNPETLYFSHFMLQDDVSSMDVYNGEDGAEYILLLDSETNTNFPEPTINLKDLD